MSSEEMLANEPIEAKKMFVGGLSPETDDEAVKKFFAEKLSAGEEAIDSVFVKRDGKDGKQPSRLYGFITFTNSDQMHEIFLQRPLELNGRTLEVKHATPRGSDPNNKTSKLFVRPLPRDNPEESEKAIKDYLNGRYAEKFGYVVKVKLTRSQEEPEKCKRYGFVECSNDDHADRISLCEKKYTYSGETIEFKKSEPRGGSAGGRGGRGGRGGGYGQQRGGGGRGGYQTGGYGGYGGYGGGYGWGYQPY